MSFAGLALPGADRSSRWLLLASLALNLFFIGVGGALLWQRSDSAAISRNTAVDRSVAGRISRIAARLPPADADKLQAAYRASKSELDGAHATYAGMQEAVRAALRAEPFDIDALRAAMAKLRAARQAYDLRSQDFFAKVASNISSAGRHRLADWRSVRRDTTRPASNDGTR